MFYNYCFLFYALYIVKNGSINMEKNKKNPLQKIKNKIDVKCLIQSNNKWRYNSFIAIFFLLHVS